MTEKLYDTDAYLATFSATVLECIPVDGGFDVVLDRTAFFPEGGGQYGDTGSLNEIPVTDTQIRDGIIYHRTQSPLSVGQTVTGTLNWEERYRRMQNHSGEHILSGVVRRILYRNNVGFHLGADFMTVDFDGELSGWDLEDLENAVNRIVWENRAIRCEYPSDEELENLWYRSKKELTGAVRIVTVEGVDCCACCAPHVKNTGEIGGIYIVDAIKWKEGTRLTVRCGSDALHEYRKLRSDERALSALLSAPRGENASAAEKLQKDYADLRRRHNLLQKEYALLKLENQPFAEGNLCFSSPCAEADVMRAVANEGVKKCTGCFVCLAGDDGAGYRYVIAAAGNLRAKANQINAALSGRGGGSDTMIQGSFSATEEQIREFFKEFNV